MPYETKSLKYHILRHGNEVYVVQGEIKDPDLVLGFTIASAQSFAAQLFNPKPMTDYQWRWLRRHALDIRAKREGKENEHG